MTGIVILEYNNSKDTINCVNSIIKHVSPLDIRIVIVSNGSDDYIKKEIQESFMNLDIKIISEKHSEQLEDNKDYPFITYLQLDYNMGYAKGNNEGATYLCTNKNIDSILILNNDTLFINDLIKPLHKALLNLHDACIVTPLLLEKDIKTISRFTAKHKCDYNYFFWRYLFGGSKPFGFDKCKHYYIDAMNIDQDIIEIGVAWGACFMIKKEDWLKIKGFDSNTFLYFEEDILSKKIELLNKKTYLIKECTCVHLGGQSTSVLKSTSPIDCYYHSMIYYLTKYEHTNCVKLLFLKFLFNFYVFRIRHGLFK